MAEKYLFNISLEKTLLWKNDEISHLNFLWMNEAINRGHYILINCKESESFVLNKFKKYSPQFKKFFFSTSFGSDILKFNKDGEKEYISRITMSGREIDDLSTIFEKNKINWTINADSSRVFGGEFSHTNKSLESKDVQHVQYESDMISGYKTIEAYGKDQDTIFQLVRDINNSSLKAFATIANNGIKAIISSHLVSTAKAIDEVKDDIEEDLEVVVMGATKEDMLAIKRGDINYIMSDGDKDLQKNSGVYIVDNTYGDGVANSIKQTLLIDHPIIIAHRGGLSSHLENSRQAFDNAYNFLDKLRDLGSDLYFYVDVRITNDDEVVAFRDEDFSLMTESDIKVSDMSVDKFLSIKPKWRGSEYSLLKIDTLLKRYRDINTFYMHIQDNNSLGDKTFEMLIEMIVENNCESKVVLIVDDEQSNLKYKNKIAALGLSISISASSQEIDTLLSNPLKIGKKTESPLRSSCVILDSSKKTKFFKSSMINKNTTNILRNEGMFSIFKMDVDSDLKERDFIKMQNLNTYGVIVNNVENAFVILQTIDDV